MCLVEEIRWPSLGNLKRTIDNSTLNIPFRVEYSNGIHDLVGKMHNPPSFSTLKQRLGPIRSQGTTFLSCLNILNKREISTMNKQRCGAFCQRKWSLWEPLLSHGHWSALTVNGSPLIGLWHYERIRVKKRIAHTPFAATYQAISLFTPASKSLSYRAMNVQILALMPGLNELPFHRFGAFLLRQLIINKY